jgi:hypothetical protein
MTICRLCSMWLNNNLSVPVAHRVSSMTRRASVHGKGRVVPKSPLILEAQDVVIDLHVATAPNLMHLALQYWRIDLGGPPRLTRNQQHLRLTTTGATGGEGTLDLAQLRMVETGRLLPPMQRGCSKTHITLTMRYSDELLKEMFLPRRWHHVTSAHVATAACFQSP